jgi:hypothetical protein
MNDLHCLNAVFPPNIVNSETHTSTFYIAANYIYIMGFTRIRGSIISAWHTLPFTPHAGVFHPAVRHVIDPESRHIIQNDTSYLEVSESLIHLINMPVNIPACRP